MVDPLNNYDAYVAGICDHQTARLRATDEVLRDNTLNYDQRVRAHLQQLLDTKLDSGAITVPAPAEKAA